MVPRYQQPDRSVGNGGRPVQRPAADEVREGLRKDRPNTTEPTAAVDPGSQHRRLHDS